LPKGEDPDTFIRSKGKAALEQLLGEAVPLADFYFTWLEERYGLSLEGKSQIAQEIARVLKKVHNPLEADLLVRRAVDFGVREDLLREPLRAAGEARRPAASAPIAGAAPSDAGNDAAERSLVGLLLRFPSMIQRVAEEAELEAVVSPAWNEILQVIFAEWRRRNTVDAAGLAERFSDRAAELAGLVLEGETIAEEDAGKMTGDLIVHLRARHLKSLRRDLWRAMRIAEEKHDEKTKKERMIEWQEVVRREQQLTRQ
jgi:DNA primase